MNVCRVEIHNHQHEITFSFDEDAVCSLVETVLSCEGTTADLVEIHFMSDSEMRHYHDVHFQDPSSTDCISFPIDSEQIDDGPRVLGDILVCPKTALTYIQQHGGSFQNEFALYIVHGLLHLLGYDDIDDEQKKSMRSAEQRSLDAFSAKFPNKAWICLQN